MGSYSKDGHVWIYHATTAVAQKSSKALNQLASLRIVIAVFNMEQEAMTAQIDSW